MASFTAWTADDSQKFNIAVDLSAYLISDSPAASPPAGYTVSILRVSPVMPTPTLDSNGRPT